MAEFIYMYRFSRYRFAEYSQPPYSNVRKSLTNALQRSGREHHMVCS